MIRLKGVGCAEISFVEQPMNGFQLEYRDGVARGVVAVPDLPSRHGDHGGEPIVVNAQEIARARDDWHKRGTWLGIDHSHWLDARHVELLDDELTRRKSAEIPAGSWVLTVRAKHPRLRHWLARGVLRGFSPNLTGDIDPDTGRDSLCVAATELLEKASADTRARLLDVCSRITGERYSVSKRFAPTRVVKVADEPNFTLVVASVLVPEEVDRQGDVISAEEIELAAHDFMENSQTAGKMHREKLSRGECVIVESYILRKRTRFGDIDLPKGAWMMAMKAYDPDLRRSILEGTFQGFSIGGKAMHLETTT